MSSQNTSQKTNIILCDLPLKTSESDIKTFLSSYKDDIDSIKINENKPQKATITFKDFDIANKCRIELNQKKLKGKNIRIMREEKDFLLKNKDNKNNLYIKGIPTNKDAREIFEYFFKFGDIFSLKLNEDDKGNNIGTAFLTYYKEEDAKKSMEQTNGKKIWGSDMEAQYKTNNEKFYKNNFNKKRSSKIIINNFPDNYTDKEIKNLCEEFGKIETCEVKTGKNGKFALVKFSKEEEAKKAIEKLNNKEIEKKKLYVKEFHNYHHNYQYHNNNSFNYYKYNNYAQNFLYQNININNINNINIPSYPKIEESIENNNLYIKNIPYEATEEDLKKTFEQFGHITSIKLEEDTDITKEIKEKEKKKFINKTFGYISFEKVEDAKKALNTLQGKKLIGFETWFKPLIIDYFIPKIRRQNMNLLNITPSPIIYPAMQGPFPPFMIPMNIPMNQMPNKRNAWPRNNYGYGRKYNNYRGRYKGGKNNQRRNVNNDKDKKIKFDYETFNALKNDDEKKNFLGEKLFELIQENKIIKDKKESSDTVGKITGMIMDIPNEEIIEILENPLKLNSRIEEALKLIENNK